MSIGTPVAIICQDGQLSSELQALSRSCHITPTPSELLPAERRYCLHLMPTLLGFKVQDSSDLAMSNVTTRWHALMASLLLTYSAPRKMVVIPPSMKRQALQTVQGGTEIVLHGSFHHRAIFEAEVAWFSGTDLDCEVSSKIMYTSHQKTEPKRRRMWSRIFVIGKHRFTSKLEELPLRPWQQMQTRSLESARTRTPMIMMLLDHTIAKRRQRIEKSLWQCLVQGWWRLLIHTIPMECSRHSAVFFTDSHWHHCDGAACEDWQIWSASKTWTKDSRQQVCASQQGPCPDICIAGVCRVWPVHIA